jgi:hypothetical protein
MKLHLILSDPDDSGGSEIIRRSIRYREQNGTLSVDGMKKKPSAQGHRWTSPTPVGCPSRAESGDHKEKWALLLEGKWGLMVPGGESGDPIDDGSMATDGARK